MLKLKSNVTLTDLYLLDLTAAMLKKCARIHPSHIKRLQSDEQRTEAQFAPVVDVHVRLNIIL